MSVCVCVCVRARVCVCTDVCVCVRVRMHACSEHYSCVCGRMSVEEAGAGERGENVRYIFFAHLFYIYSYFKCTVLILEPMYQRNISMFMLCILMNNTDSFG